MKTVFRNKILEKILEIKKEKLREGLDWFPIPFFISVLMAMILLAHVFQGINPRLGNPAALITFSSEPEKEGAIWFSVSMEDQKNILITTRSRSVFRWSIEKPTQKDVGDFINYLKTQMLNESISVGLIGDSTVTQTTAVIAADQNLSFNHIRPIIHALAQAKINNYAFETVPN